MRIYSKKWMITGFSIFFIFFLFFCYFFIIPTIHILRINLTGVTSSNFIQAYRINNYLSSCNIDYSTLTFVQTDSTFHDVYKLENENNNLDYYVVLQSTNKDILVVSEVDNIRSFYGLMDPATYCLISNFD